MNEQNYPTTGEAKEVIYTADSQLKNPKRFLATLWTDIKTSRSLGWRFFINSFRSQYRQSWLGYLWLFIPPLSTAFIWIYLSRVNILNTQNIDNNYPIFVLSGVFLWQTFVEALYAPLQQISAHRHLLVKIKMPHEVYIIAGLGSLGFNLIIRAIFLLAALLFFSVPLKAAMLLAPFGILALVALALALGLFITPFGILYKDIISGMNILAAAWFFITPVIYYLPAQHSYGYLLRLNPVTPLLNTTRNWLLKGEINIEKAFVLTAILSFAGLILSWIFYRLAQPHLITRIAD